VVGIAQFHRNGKIKTGGTAAQTGNTHHAPPNML
jgi:hypothetical protein